MSFRAYSKTTDRKDEFAVLTGIAVLLIFSNFLVTEFFQSLLLLTCWVVVICFNKIHQLHSSNCSPFGVNKESISHFLFLEQLTMVTCMVSYRNTNHICRFVQVKGKRKSKHNKQR